MATAGEVAAMRRAVALAADAPWLAHPRPTVGAVVLDPAGVQVGEGVTEPGGRHAEPVALAAAGEAARGGTLVATLEPCAATGRTGACTSAVVSAGVRRVVYAVTDPLPPFAGGAGQLSAAGVDVEGGVLAEEAWATLAGWLGAAGASRPVVTWKAAATLDGRTAAVDGTSRWITGPAARRQAHELRARHDAVLVGIATVLADDPALTVRDAEGADPLRVVADTSGRTPAGARLLGPGAVLAIAGDTPDPGLDAEILRVPRGPAGLDPQALLGALAGRGVRSVLLEGGARLAGAFAAAGLIDRAFLFLAPQLLGDGTPLLQDVGLATITAAQRWRIEDVTRVGDDLRVIARPVREG